MTTTPTTHLHPDFSDAHASATPWEDAVARLRRAPVSWISTVRPDGRPHVTPLITVWLDDAIVFCTGPTERKALNLGVEARCAMTTGTDSLDAGIDIVVEGRAEPVVDQATLERVAEAYRDKYGQEWAFEPRDGALHHQEGGSALAFRVEPAVAFAFAKGDPFSQTRYRF